MRKNSVIHLPTTGQPEVRLVRGLLIQFNCSVEMAIANTTRAPAP